MKNYVREFLLDYDCPMEYLGFSVLCDALCVACEYLGEVKPNLKCIYLEVGRKQKMSRLSIERNLRTLIKVWSVKPKFKELFDEVPTNAKLIISLSHKILRPNSSVYDILLS